MNENTLGNLGRSRVNLRALRLLISVSLVFLQASSVDAQQSSSVQNPHKAAPDQRMKAGSTAPGYSPRDLHCSSFKWVSAEGISDKAAILVPISLNGKDYHYQLDTGADVTIPYGAGKNPDWTPQGNAVRIPRVSFGGMSFPAIRAYPKPDTEPNADVQGTVGLDILVGHTAILDFPNQRFCLIESANLPEDLRQRADWTPAETRHGKLFVEVEVNDHKLDQILYDTGSSSSALDVDLALWKDLTGKNGSSDATVHFRAPSWGKELEIIGAPASGQLKIGRQVFSHPLVTTFPAQPDSYSTDYKAQGLLGNALFQDDIIILDLSAHPMFGMVSPPR